IAVDSGESGVDRSRPRVALRGPKILVAWQERSAAPESAIYAALADELGATLPVPATRLDATPDGREPRNPQPWLQADGTGGVLWESRAQRSRERLPIPSAEPERTL